VKLQKANYKKQTNWFNMVGSEALGTPLVKQTDFAADMLFFQANQSTCLHTHPGNHILYVVSGSGFLLFAEERHVLTQGDCYFVPGEVPHQVSASKLSSMHLLSIADNHRPVWSEERLNKL